MLLKAENPKSKIDPKAISKSYLRKIHQIFIWSVDSDLSIQYKTRIQNPVKHRRFSQKRSS